MRLLPLALIGIGALLVLDGAVPAPQPGRGPRRRRAPDLFVVALAVVGAAVAVVVAAALDGGAGGLPLVGTAAAGVGVIGLGGHLRRRRRRARALVLADQVESVCRQLAADLGSGAAPDRVLLRAAGRLPLLDPVARAAALGGDVPGAFGQLARRPGAAGLARVGAAWQVAHELGAPLATVLTQIAGQVAVETDRARRIDAEMAAAFATVHLLAALPLGLHLLARGAGIDALGFLIGSPLGVGCLWGGVGLILVGLAWMDAMAGRLR